MGGTKDKYGLSQSDFYQLFAYGHRYLPGEGQMLLIYPMTHRFQQPLPVFTYSQHLHLRVVPFDLQNDRLVEDLSLTSGFWVAHTDEVVQ